MTIVLLCLVSLSILVLAYFTYGRFVSSKLQINDRNKTPAHTHHDGVDFEPGKTPVVLGHHFASIAGAGPIVGPVIAVSFGWIPAVIWILIGGIFLGAVHDLTSLIASMRHQGKSIGAIIEKYVGKEGKKLFLIFSFATLVLIISVFTDIIARTFVNNPGAASSSIMFIVVALIFGVLNKRFTSKRSFLVISFVGVLLMYFFVSVGSMLPINLSYYVWVIVLMVYAFVASVTPVSFLLQPRDYLSSFLLYGLIIMGLAGVLFVNPEIKMTTDVQFKVNDLGYLFPVLFVTIACGAISGFHSLVASGTTSKQINKESDAKVIGYGGMLIESFLAIVAICSVIILSQQEYSSRLLSEGPVSLFASGLGGIISSLGLPADLTVTFVALAVSSFALTTLDTCTRLGRFVVQEYCEEAATPPTKILAKNRYLATTFVIILSMLLLASGSFTTLWPIFGSANQLLAALALLAISLWLIKNRTRALFVLVPTCFMFAVTLTSLFLFAWNNFSKGAYVLCIISTLLFLLSVTVIWLAIKSLRKEEALESSPQ